jgi:transcription termination/antitermination protein NusG
MSEKARWYVVQVYAGFEKKVAETILEHAERDGLAERVVEVYSPAEEVNEVKNGRRTTTTRNMHGGYLYLKAYMNEDVMRLVRAVPRVSGFLGADHKPCAVSEAEVARIKKIADEVPTAATGLSFEMGESVKITQGPFETFSGFVEEVFEDRRRLRVMVVIFGRETPVELEYSQVVKV